MWKGPREFLHYSRRQRNGIFVLLGLVVLIWLFLLFDQHFYRLPPQDVEHLHQAVLAWEEEDSLARYAFTQNLKPFDPNTLDSAGWRKLGLNEKQTATIQNFRNKGGKFHRPEDLARIWGLDSFWLYHALPFVTIDEKNSLTSASRARRWQTFDPNKVTAEELQQMGLLPWQAERIITYRSKVDSFRRPEDLYKVYGIDSALAGEMQKYLHIKNIAPAKRTAPIPKVIDINRADSLQLISVAGIGPVFARRIIRYRQRLGGFYSLDQLREVYGMDDARFQMLQEKLTWSPVALQKLNINQASFEELLAHPYLEYEVVRNIIHFRTHSRPFRELDELRHIELVDDLLFSKIANYLEV